MARNLLADYPCDPLVEALDAVYGAQTERKLETLFSLITPVDEEEPILVRNPVPSHLTKAFLPYGTEACLFAFRRYEQE
jgi:hypothetical protein